MKKSPKKEIKAEGSEKNHKAPCCGRSWIEHPGIILTCKAYKEAVRAMRHAQYYLMNNTSVGVASLEKNLLATALHHAPEEWKK